MLVTLITYGAGLAAASLWNVIFAKPFPFTYFAVFSTVAIVSLLTLFINQSKVTEQVN